MKPPYSSVPRITSRWAQVCAEGMENFCCEDSSLSRHQFWCPTHANRSGNSGLESHVFCLYWLKFPLFTHHKHPYLVCLEVSRHGILSSWQSLIRLINLFLTIDPKFYHLSPASAHLLQDIWEDSDWQRVEHITLFVWLWSLNVINQSHKYTS